MSRTGSASIVALVVATLASAAPAVAQPRALPTIQAADLNGRAFAFPRDMTGDAALGIFVYRREDQAEATRLLRLVQAAVGDRPGLMVREFPVIAAPGLARGFIQSGMRDGIPARDDRAKVVTLFVPDMAAWRRATGFSDPRGVWLARVSGGVIVASAPSSTLRSEADVRRFLDAR